MGNAPPWYWLATQSLLQSFWVNEVSRTSSVLSRKTKANSRNLQETNFLLLPSSSSFSNPISDEKTFNLKKRKHQFLPITRYSQKVVKSSKRHSLRQVKEEVRVQQRFHPVINPGSTAMDHLVQEIKENLKLGAAPPPPTPAIQLQTQTPQMAADQMAEPSYQPPYQPPSGQSPCGKIKAGLGFLHTSLRHFGIEIAGNMNCMSFEKI